jgi:AraC-like DNA-binding protein
MREKNNITPIYSTPGNSKKIAVFNAASPWKNADVAFTWVNFEYPMMHTHEYWELFFIAAGTIDHIINGRRQTLIKGDACLIRPSDEHCLLFTDRNQNKSYQHINFIIDPKYAEQIFFNYGAGCRAALLNSPNALSFKLDPQKTNSMMERCLTIQTIDAPIEQKIFQCKIIAVDLINDFMKQKHFFSNAYPEWMKNLLFIINNPNFNSDSMETLAENTPYSYSRLSRIFKSLTGMTLTEYIIGVKMSYAKELLQNSDMTILAIASEINYESLSYFNRTFKKHFNLTPKAFRNLHR